MGLSVFSTLGAGTATLVAWYMVTRKKQRSRYPPGPYPLPMIGHLREFGGSKPWLYLTDLQKTYGDVTTIFLATSPCVILNSLESVREAFLTNGNEFAGRPYNFALDQFSKGGKDIIAGQFGPIWKKQRKVAHAAMRKFASGDFLAQLVNNSFQKSAVVLDKVAETGEKFNPKHLIDMTIYNIIFSMIFGKTVEHDDKTLNNLIELMDEVNEVLSSGLLADLIPIFKRIPTKAVRVVKRAIAEMFKLADDIYDQHEKNFDSTKINDIVDHILQSINELENEEGKAATEGLTADHYKLIILDIFSAGIDTSRYTMLWVVLYMAAYPEYQKKMQEEIDSVVGKDNTISIKDHSWLPFTEAFLHEVLRIRPLGPLGLPHETNANTSVGGFPIPVGTMVMPNIWAIHMDKEKWGDPEVFRPERFLDEDGKMGPRISSWLPFSTGRRVCVGEAVAKAELHLTIASFIQRYNFAAPPGVTLNCEIKDMGQAVLPYDYELIITRRV